LPNQKIGSQLNILKYLLKPENIEAIKIIFINSFFLAITIGTIITSGGIGKNELSIKDTRPK
jgi:Na+/pantothenate symporter